MIVTNLFLVLWWMQHHKEPGYYDRLLDMVQMDIDQEMFAAALPKSGLKLAGEALESFESIEESLVNKYKQHFLDDMPRDNRRLVHLEIMKCRVAIEDLRRFVDEATFAD